MSRTTDALLALSHAVGRSSDSSTEPNELEVITSAVPDEFEWETVAVAVGILVAAVIASRLVKAFIIRVFRRRIDPALATLIGRLVAYVIVVVGLVYSLDVLGVAILPVVGALGIAGIALAFAFQDLLENFVAGVLLQLQRPFTLDDQVEINDHEGTVIGIDSRIVTIVTPAGETIKIPSSTVIKSDINNYTQQGRRRTTLPVGVAYGTDLERARDVLDEAVRSVDRVLDHPAPEIFLTGFGASSIDFDVRFWHTPSIAELWATRHEVAAAVDRALADAEITIPFPQRTVWYGADES